MTAVRLVAVRIDRWHWAFVIVAAPFLLFPTPGRSLALLLIPAIWFAAWLANGEPVPRTPLNATILLLSLMMLISLYATYSITVSLPKIAGAVLGMGVFYSVVRVGHDPNRWRLSFLAFMVIGIGVAVIGLLGTQWLNKVAFLSPILDRLPPVLRGLPGAEGGFQPNEVAGTLLWVLPAMFVAVGWTWRAGRRQRIALLALSAVSALFVLSVFVLTQSRSGYIGLAVALSAMLITAASTRLRKWLAVGALAGLIVAAVVVWQRSADPIVQDKVGSAALSLDTLEGRFEVWSRAIYGIEDFPLTGMGMNTFRSIVHVLYPLFIVAPEVDIAHAHNEFLQAALDLGLPGLIAFLAMYIIAFWMLWEIWRAAPSPLPTRALALGLGGGLFAHLIYGLTDAVTLGAKPGILFWMLLGLITALFLQTQAVTRPAQA